jgi:hypothetical protein
MSGVSPQVCNPITKGNHATGGGIRYPGESRGNVRTNRKCRT